jgi:DNA-binding transcriptional ArsR family regulator
MYLLRHILVFMDIFEVVAEPSRRAVLDRLAERPQPAGELVGALPDLSQPAVSRHLRVLREAGLVQVEARGQQRIYSLRAEPLAELDGWLDRYRRFWTDHLDDLEAHLARRSPTTATTPSPHPRRTTRR